MTPDDPADPSFEEFLAAHWAALYRTAYLLTGQHHQAEDLLQDVLARTCVLWHSIRDKAAASGYVRRGLVHQASRQWRRRGRERSVDQVPETGHDGGIALRADQLALWSALRDLPPRMRATVVLRYLEDLTEQETADLLGVSVGTVKSQTHHALTRLRTTVPSLDPRHDPTRDPDLEVQP